LQLHPFSPVLDGIFVALQSLVALFLLLHDWVPLGKLNNLKAIRSQDSFRKQMLVTLLPAIPVLVCLFGSVRAFGRMYPGWLPITFWITYGTLLAGMLQAWWIPYLLIPDPVRAARYQVIFAGTHAFLPRRNGIVPDTLHTIFHFVFLGTFLLFLLREFGI
jgi:hypothetical protein